MPSPISVASQLFLTNELHTRSQALINTYTIDQIKGIVVILSHHPWTDEIYGFKLFRLGFWESDIDTRNSIVSQHERVFNHELLAIVDQGQIPGVPYIPTLDIIKFDSFATIEKLLYLTRHQGNGLAYLKIQYVAIVIEDREQDILSLEDLDVLKPFVEACLSLQDIYFVVPNGVNAAAIGTSARAAIGTWYEMCLQEGSEQENNGDGDIEFWEIPNVHVIDEDTFALRFFGNGEDDGEDLFEDSE